MVIYVMNWSFHSSGKKTIPRGAWQNVEEAVKGTWKPGIIQQVSRASPIFEPLFPLSIGHQIWATVCLTY